LATDNPTWGYTRMQGALKNLGHRVARSTVARILREQGIPPSRERPMTWQTFVGVHWRAFLAADFFTTEVWTARGLVTYYTAFVIELHSRRVYVLGTTPYPDEAFIIQTMRHLTNTVDGVLGANRLLICDRDRKWSLGVERFLAAAGVRVIRTPASAPNCNAHADRFVRSMKEECLNRVIPLGERHFRRTLADFVAHYHGERNHQGLGNELIDPPQPQRCRWSRLPPAARRWTSQLLLPCRCVPRDTGQRASRGFGHYAVGPVGARGGRTARSPA
jgi:putative transposase